MEAGIDWCVSSEPVEMSNGEPVDLAVMAPDGLGVFISGGQQWELFSTARDEVAGALDAEPGSYPSHHRNDQVLFTSPDAAGGTIWHPERGQVRYDPQDPDDEEDLVGSISDDGTTVLSWLTSSDTDDYGLPVTAGTVVRDVSGGELIRRLDVEAALLPDGDRVVVSNESGLTVRPLDGDEVLAELRGAGVRAVDADRTRIITSTFGRDDAGTGTGTVYSYPLDDLDSPPLELRGELVGLSPDGNNAVIVDEARPANDEAGNRLDQSAHLIDLTTGDPVIPTIESPFLIRGSLEDPDDSLAGTRAFSHDSRYLALWAETEAGVGVHIVDLQRHEVVDVIPSNSGPLLRFDQLTNVLYIVDRSTSQLARVDLDERTIVVGEPFFSTFDTTVPLVQGDRLIFRTSTGFHNCRLRTVADGEGDGSGPVEPTAAPDETVDVDDVEEFAVPPGGCGDAGGDVQLQDGVFSEDVSGATVRYSVDHAVHADLNRDTVDDAAFVISCNLGGNSVFQSLYLWLGGQEPQNLDDELAFAASPLTKAMGALSNIEDISAGGHLINVDWLGMQSNDPQSGPSVKMTSVFAVQQNGDVRFLRNEATSEAAEQFELPSQ